MPNSVQKAMMILRKIADATGHPVTVTRLSEQTGIQKSTLAHILKTLCEEHYLVRVSHNEGYVLGPELYLLTRYGRYGVDIIHECHPILRYIHKKTGATATFSVLKSNRKYIIDRVADDNVYPDKSAELLVDDLYRTVTGRVLLANIPPVDALEVWDNYGPPTAKDHWPEVTDRTSFETELQAIRRQDCQYLYYCVREEGCQWFTYAAPVFRDNSFIGALGFGFPRSLDTPAPTSGDKKQMKALLLHCRKELERRLQFDLPEKEKSAQ